MKFKIKGGFDITPIKDSDFKYTTNTDRINWVKNTFSNGFYLLNLITNIPWNSYSFNGNVTLRYNNTSNSNNNGFHLTKNNNTNDQSYFFEDVLCSANTSRIKPYYFFGGCQYEIFNFSFNKLNTLPNIRDFIDPTGDIDVSIILPAISYKNTDYDYDYYLYTSNNENTRTINQLIDDYTKWIFNQLKIQLTKIPLPLFHKIFPDIVEFDYKDDDEGQFADLAFNYHNLWLIRSIIPNTNNIKIQLIAKFPNTKPNHIIELILILNIDNRFIEKNNINAFNKSILVLPNNLQVSHIHELYNENMDSIKNRKELFSTHIDYKLYNHIGRLQYLNNLLPLILSPSNTSYNKFITLTPANITSIRTYSSLLIKFFFTEKQQDISFNNSKISQICAFDYNFIKTNTCPDTNTFIQSLSSNLLPFIFKDTFNKYTKKRDIYIANTTHNINGKLYTIYDIVADIFPDYIIKQQNAGYRRCQSYNKKKKHTRSRFAVAALNKKKRKTIRRCNI
jgi:hypothetical protein